MRKIIWVLDNELLNLSDLRGNSCLTYNVKNSFHGVWLHVRLVQLYMQKK